MFFKKKKKIICIGSSSKDIFFPTDKGVIFDTPEDLTAQKKIAFELGAKYQVKERFESLGGCAANVAAGLAKLGIDVDCCTKIGDDAVGEWIEKQFASAGVGTRIIQKQSQCKSDLSSIIIDISTAERIIFSDRDANEKLEIIPADLDGAEWFFVSSLNGDWQGHLEQILEIANKNGTKVAFNPGQRNIATDPGMVARFASNSQLIFVNKDEALEIVKHLNAGATDNQLNDENYLLESLSKNGCEIVVITDGTRGAWARKENEIFHAGALLVDAIDTTGSGDAFTSGFFGLKLKEKSIEESLKYGIVSSSNCVKYYGGQAGLLDEKVMQNDITKVDISKIK